MSEQQEKSLAVHRLKFLALISIFILPFIAAWVALYVFDYRPGSKNYGELVQPVRTLEFPALMARDNRQLDDEFWTKWTFVILDNGECAKLCRDNLYYLRQMRVALGRDVNRVQNLLIMKQAVNSELDTFLAEYPELTVIEQAEQSLLEKFRLPEREPGEASILYLVDPAGNLMMTYPAVNDPSSILSDMRRLLKVSQIG
ncbi:MAG: hypothetical protein QNJ69_10150 [Gammaproteobacteria bacterium]|nr:hypothetical protein [Gammaproteobacteria bacterium]